MSLSVSCTDDDIKVHEDFTTVMVLLSINTSESYLQRGPSLAAVSMECLWALCYWSPFPSKNSHLPTTLIYWRDQHDNCKWEFQSLTLKMPWSECSCSKQVPTCQWSNMWLQLYFLQQHSAWKCESKIYPCFIWVEMIGPSWSSSSSMRGCRLYQNIGWLCCGIAWTYGT